MPEGRRRKRKAVTFSSTDKDVPQGDEKKEERYVPRFPTKRARVAPSTRSRTTGPMEDETALPVNGSEERVAEKQEESSMITCTVVQQVMYVEN